MVCSKCGSQIEGTAKFCGKCGAVIPTSPASQEEDSVGKLIDSMEAKKKRKKRNTIVGASFVVCVCVVGIFIMNLAFGLNASVRKYMKAFEANDGEVMYDMASDLTKKYVCAYCTKYPGYMNVTYYYGEDFTQEEVQEYVESLYTQEFKYKSEDFFNEFDKKLGSDYKVSYKITDVEDPDPEAFTYFNKDVHEITSKVTYSGIKTATIEVTGNSKGETYSKTLTLELSNEKLSWKPMFAEKLF